MMELINFVNMGTDERILKSLPVEDCPEELVKAMNKQGLVQKEVTVQSANGKTFTRKQWVRASDAQATTMNSPKRADSPRAKVMAAKADALKNRAGKIGDTLKTSNGDYKIVKVNLNNYTVKSPQGIISQVSEDFVKDHLQSQQSDPINLPQSSSNDNKKQSAAIDPLFKLPAHGDAKKAVADMLASGKSRDDIMSAAKAAGITWTSNDNPGINWMRASMAIQKHMADGSATPASVQPVNQVTPQAALTTQTPKYTPTKEDRELSKTIKEYVNTTRPQDEKTVIFGMSNPRRFCKISKIEFNNSGDLVLTITEPVSSAIYNGEAEGDDVDQVISKISRNCGLSKHFDISSPQQEILPDRKRVNCKDRNGYIYKTRDVAYKHQVTLLNWHLNKQA